MIPTTRLGKWRVPVLVTASSIVVIGVVYNVMNRSGSAPALEGEPAFVGGNACISCHADAYEAWRGSDHDNAMDVAADSTVLGDFSDATFVSGNIRARFYTRDGRYFVRTAGADGVDADFEVDYTFGVEPLQQYLISFPGGRMQALSIAWDTVRQEWFFLYPDEEIPHGDWLHWTRGGQNWNGMCADCHSTNLVKNYDPESKSFATTWVDIDVNCEACHGPGSHHVAWAEAPPKARPRVSNLGLAVRTSGISSREQVEACAPCHSRRRELGEYDHKRPDLLDNVIPSILEPHLYHADGQILDEVYVYGSFVQSRMYSKGVRCSNCHDVHSLQLIKQGNDLCLQCHDGAIYDNTAHHFHKKEQDGRPSEGHLCVKCHMPERPYMVVDWRADHSMRVPRPDLTAALGVPNSCAQAGCHDDKPAQWAADHFARWYGKDQELHYGTVLSLARDGDPSASAMLVELLSDSLTPDIVRATALSLLPAYPGVESAAALSNALSDTEALVRYTAAQSINRANPADLVNFLVPLLSDSVVAVRTAAAARLAGAPDELFNPGQRAALTNALNEYIAMTSYSLDFSFAGHNLGNLYTQLQDPEKATAYYHTAIEIDDLFYPAKINLAMLYNASGKNDEAEHLLRDVVGDYPEEYEAAYSLALLLAEMGRLAEAVPFMERAADGLPTRSRLRYNLGLMYQQLGEMQKAEAGLGQALALEPDNLDYLLALADHYLKRRQLAKALPLAERMILSHPGNPVGHQVKAQIEQMSASGD